MPEPQVIRNFRRHDTDGLWRMTVADGIIQELGHDTGTDGETDLIVPGLIDAHCHILPTGLDLQKLHLGKFQTPQEVLDAVRDFERGLPEGSWCLAVHYDQTKFPTGEHLNREQLDAISPVRPILLRHVNGHASVANSAALVAAGVTEKTPDPDGGEFVRDSSGRMTGVLLEIAHEAVTGAIPCPTLDEMVDAILRASEKFRELGIVCATDMQTGRFDLANELRAYQIAAETSGVKYRLFVQWSKILGPRPIDSILLKEIEANGNRDLSRIEGVKIFADGAIGSATAAIYGSYHGKPHQATSGQLIYSPERLAEMIRIADQAGHRIAIHSIGDYSTDLVLKAYEQTADPTRHRLEHAMLMSDEQIAHLARLGCHCTMQPEFLVRFGHAYQRQLGPDRSWKLKRMRSVIDAGISLSLNSDRPIVAGDPRDGIRNAINRPEGFDPAENISFVEAVDGYTKHAAIANGDADSQGSLKVGRAADFCKLTL